MDDKDSKRFVIMVFGGSVVLCIKLPYSAEPLVYLDNFWNGTWGIWDILICEWLVSGMGVSSCKNETTEKNIF